ncbi:MAG: T9SS type A sorting domain-containing protein [Bacteroidales bacterium]
MKHKVDYNGNLYIYGEFGDTVYFGDKDSWIVPADSLDFFISKIYPDGTPAWLKLFSGIGAEHINDLEIDNESNIYFTGAFDYTLTFDVQTWDNGGPYEYIVAKLDSTGKLLKMVLGTEAQDLLDNGESLLFGDLAIGPTGKIFIEGTSLQSYSDFLLRLDNNLIANWEEEKEDINGYYYTSVNFDQHDNIYVSGYKNDSLKIKKLDKDLLLVWETIFSGKSNTHLQKVYTDKYSNVYWVSNIFSPVDFDEEATGEQGGAVIARFDEYGNYSWSKAINGYLWSFVVDNTGYFISTYSSTTQQGFLIIDPEGQIILDQTSDSIRFQQVSLDPYGNVYYCGSLVQEVTIDGDTIAIYNGENYIFGSLKSFWISEAAGKVNEKIVNRIITYPNPATEYITIALPKEQNALVGVYDLNGRQLLKRSLPGGTKELNISEIASGIYVLRIKSGDYMWTSKVVIE